MRSSAADAADAEQTDVAVVPAGDAYATVAQAIRFIAAHQAAQPSLAAIAEHVGLSEFHLQRVFSAWAGVSPKRFIQFLTKEHARALLRESQDVLTAALGSGLSGPGRLHDLLVCCDAVSPGEVRRLGDGLCIRYGVGMTPFGQAMIGVTVRGVCHLRFVEDPAAGLDALRAAWPAAQLQFAGDAAQALLDRIFVRVGASGGVAAGRRTGCASPEKPLPLLLQGTNFQIKVWEALLAIPEGWATSYGELARHLGMPGAARAVGRAIGANPVAWLIPCHRVLRESGELGGYRWGLERKQALLAWEASAREAAGVR